MSRFFMRRGRILPGPLKALPLEDIRSPVPVTSLAVTAAAIAAGLFLLPHLAPQVSVDPQPMAEIAEANEPKPEAVAYAVTDDANSLASLRRPATSTSPSPVAEPVAVSPAPHPEPVRSAVVSSAAKPSADKVAATQPPKPAADPSLFRLDVMPVLTADGGVLDDATSTPTPAPPPKRAVSRRAAASRAVAASSETSQP